MSTSDDDKTTTSGAEGQASADTATPFTPRDDDDSPVGSTDQHSKVPSHGRTPEEEGAREKPAGNTD